MNKGLRGLTFDTTVTVSVGEFVSDEFRLTIDYNYFPYVPAFTPRGEYAPIDPPEPAHVEIVNVRLWVGDTVHLPLPSFIDRLVSDDPDIYDALLRDAESPGAGWVDDDGQPDERQEWRDFDPDC